MVSKIAFKLVYLGLQEAEQTHVAFKLQSVTWSLESINIEHFSLPVPTFAHSLLKPVKNKPHIGFY